MRRSSPRGPCISIRVAARLAPPAAPSFPAPASPWNTPRFAQRDLPTGIKVHFLEQGNPEGRPVILLHGITDSWFSFSQVLPGISREHRLIALDLRGHGGSGRPAEGYAPRDMAADVLALMDALGIERATLVGHSMGSFVAQQVVLLAPGRISAMVLIGSATQFRNPVTIGLAEALEALPETVPPEFVREFQASTVHQPVPAEFMDRVVETSRRVPARVWRAALAGLIETERFTGVREATIPTLVIWGDRDAMFSRAEQAALMALFLVASLKVYRATGHAPHWERADEVVRDLQRFLRTAP